MNHCQGCHGHVYDEQREECAEHTFDDDEGRKDCPGCQECERQGIIARMARETGRRMCQALGISTDQDEEALVKACENLRRLLVEHCEEDTEIRNVLRPILGAQKTDGDSYGVPSVLDLVKAMRAGFTAAWEKANG